MWPSEATASRLYDIANIALIAALVVGVIATALVVWMGNIKEGYLTKALGDLGVEAAKANKEAAEARLALERYKAPRTLSAKDAATLIALLKPFGKVSFDVATEQSHEPASLLAQMCAALQEAGWDWQNWESGDIALKLPKQDRVVGMASVSGVEVQIAESDRAVLEKPAVELINTLVSFGIPTNGRVYLDEAAKTLGRKNGLMHIIVGSKRPE